MSTLSVLILCCIAAASTDSVGMCMQYAISIVHVVTRKLLSRFAVSLRLVGTDYPSAGRVEVGLGKKRLFCHICMAQRLCKYDICMSSCAR